MTSEVVGRRRDAGAVHVSSRDVAVLRFIGETGGARLSLLRRLLAAHGEPANVPVHPAPAQTLKRGIRPAGPVAGRSDSVTRAWVARMVRGGYLRQTQLLRATWVTVTPAGARLAGLVDDHGRAAPRVIESAMLADHTNTVGLLRLHLAREFQEASWKPERDYWIAQAGATAHFHRPDGALDFGDRIVGIEVELTPKRPERYAEIVGLTHDSLAEVWWWCPATLEHRLAQALATGVASYEEGGRFSAKPVQVRALPEEITS